jgi:putative redox protein
MDIVHSRVAGGGGETQHAPRQLVDRFDVKVKVSGPLSQEQRERLEYIAGRCPMHRTLEGTPEIRQTVEIVG